MKNVKDFMTKDPITAELPGNRRDAMNLMVKNKLTGMPVVKKGELKGFVSRHDFFKNPEEEQLAMIYRKNFPSVLGDDSIEKAAKLLVDNNTHYLPVKDKNNKCIGILTTYDILEYVEEKKIDTPVGEVARSPCVPIYEGTPIDVVLQTMKLTHLYAFPVVDKETSLVGIISDRDLFHLSKINGGIVVSELGLGEDEDSWSWEGLKNVMKLYYEESKIELPDMVAKDAMVKDPTSIYEKTEVHEAARLMRLNDFGQLPIVDEMDKLKTMVYELDLIATVI